MRVHTTSCTYHQNAIIPKNKNKPLKNYQANEQLIGQFVIQAGNLEVISAKKKISIDRLICIILK
jgi:hypothetical protein